MARHLRSRQTFKAVLHMAGVDVSRVRQAAMEAGMSLPAPEAGSQGGVAVIATSVQALVSKRSSISCKRASRWFLSEELPQ